MLDEIKKVFSPTKAATVTSDTDHVEIKEDDYDDDDDKPMIVDLKESDVVFTDYQDDDHSSQVRESLTVAESIPSQQALFLAKFSPCK